MRSVVFLAPSIIGLVAAIPAPQDIDFELAYALPNPTYTQAIGVTAQTVSYNPTTVYAAAAEQVTETVIDSAAAVATDIFLKNKRAAACATQPVGYGPVPSPDSVSAFYALPAISDAAVSAPTPSGYVKQFSNLQASNNAYGYLGYTTLKSYDVGLCASKCNAINGCISINVLYERAPSLEPGTGDSGCANPPSTTLIKCVFWGGPVNAENAVNKGQWRNKFQVVIAGSNGYTNASVAAVPGYTPATPLGNAAINAPYDQYGYSSYLGVAMFIGAFDASLCAKACSEKSAYAVAHPPTDGTPIQTCQFFNTYILYINTTSNVQGQYCAMYAQSWGSKYATNVGQWRGPDNFKIQYSFSYSNITNPGSPNPIAAVYQARNDIKWPANSAEPYCSSILGYTTPVVTTTIISTSTPLATTTATDVKTELTTTTVVSPTVTTTFVVAKRDLEPTSIQLTTINGLLAMALPTITLPSQSNDVRRRDVVLPSVLSKYPPSIVTSACSLAASPVTVTSTVTSVVTSTIPTVYTTEITSTTTTTIATEVSVTTVTTTAAATCTPAAYRIQVLGGHLNGSYLGTPSYYRDYYNYYPLDVGYGFLQSTTTSFEDATQHTIDANGRVLDRAIYPSSSWGWTVYSESALSYVLTMNDLSSRTYGYDFLRCTVGADSAVTSSPRAAGTLTCLRSLGRSINFVTCPRYSANILASPDLSVLKTWYNWEEYWSECVTVTLVAIPIYEC